VSKLREIASLRVNQGIDVVCKVMKVSDVVGVQKANGRVLKKRDVVIGDGSGCIHLVLWEGDVDSLEEGKSYSLVDVVVKQFGMVKHLSYLAHSSKNPAYDVHVILIYVM